jgi:acyl-coenzyme A synthetase/AMP-(fatty) acid ligase
MTRALPLLDRCRPESTIVHYDGRDVSVSEFLGATAQLAARLPRRQYVLNLCEDRYHFLLGFAAAVQSQQVSLLPPSHAPEVLRGLCANYPDIYCLADHEEVPRGLEMVSVRSDVRGTSKPGSIPLIAGEQTAAIVFTSGSTGTPTPHAKSWATLVHVAEAVGERIGLQPGASVLGTIPPQHLYGMETTIMLPLQFGARVHHKRPLLPADIYSMLEQIPPPRWLIATPLHLRACVADRLTIKGLGGVLSATMPLPAALADEVEGLWQTLLYDVYGCTEAGIIALRRATATAPWRTLNGLRMYQKGEEVWVEGGHVPQPVRLADRLNIVNDREFDLQGRLSDLVKIAGKRTSLEALNAELNRIEGVLDGVFFMPDDGAEAHRRLTAFVVAPGLGPDKIIAELRRHIDPVFLPRPLFLVKALPRNASGKLPREHLRQFASELTQPRRHRSG